MGIRLFYDNRGFDLLSLVPSSEATTLPALNVQNEFRTKVWRTGATQTEESIVADFGTAYSVDACIVHYTNVPKYLNGVIVDTVYEIQANVADDWSSPPTHATLNVQWGDSEFNPPNLLYFIPADVGFSPMNYPFFRYTFTKSAAGETRDTGRIFLGKMYETPVAPLRNGVEVGFVDGSEKFKGVGLNTFVEIKDKYKVITISFPPVPQTMMETLNRIYQLNGESINMYLQVGQYAPYNEILYVKMVGMLKKKLRVPQSTAPYWEVQLQFEEQL